MHKPVRKVRSNGRTIVGYMPSEHSTDVIPHESNLEKDFIYILKFDPKVVSVKAQPLEIPYSLDGKKKIYVPDFLVKYKDDSQVIFEVKYGSHVEKYRNELAPKFSAARKYAKVVGLKFKVITDAEIRTDYKTSIIFLDQFRSDVVDLELTQRILGGLHMKKKCSGNELLTWIASDDEDYNQLIRPFWVLVFNQRICCNLFEPITLNSQCWLPGEGQQKFFSYPYSTKTIK